MLQTFQSLLYCLSFDDLIPEIQEGYQKGTPQSIETALQMIELTLKNSQLVSKKEEVQRISKIALEFIEHSSEQVREKAFEILGKV